MGGNLVGDDALAHIVLVGQGEVLLRGDVAEHGRAEPADHGRADGGGDVVVGGRDVDGERSERVERRVVAPLLLEFHVLLDFVHRHVAGAFDEHLHVLLPGAEAEFAHHLQLAELGLVVGVVGAARTQPVADADRDIVLGEDVADLVPVGVEEVLFVVVAHPLGHDAAAAGDAAGETLGHGGKQVFQQSGVDGEVVNALLALFDEGVTVHLPRQLVGLAVHLLQCLVHRHGAHGNGAVADDPLSGLVDVLAGGEVHQRVAAEARAIDALLHLLLNGGTEGGVADVGVDFHEELAADDHRFGLGVVGVARNHGTARGHLIAHKLGRDVAVGVVLAEVLADGDVLHFWSHHTLTGQRHLGESDALLGLLGQIGQREGHLLFLLVRQLFVGVFGRELRQLHEVVVVGVPRLAQTRNPFPHVVLIVGVGENAAGIIEVNGSVGDSLPLDHGVGQQHLLHPDLDGKTLPLHVDFLYSVIARLHIVKSLELKVLNDIFQVKKLRS